MQEKISVHRQKFTLVLLMLTCQLLFSCGRPPGVTQTCRGPVFVHLESFDSAETGARAAVQRLSQEIHRCGEVEKYDIIWKWPSSETERGWRTLRYTRKDKTSGNIGYEYDPGSGTGETYWVDDSAVEQVAKEGGTLRDFAKYQKKD